nr:ABC transporter [Candidatus Desulfobacula maris]
MKELIHRLFLKPVLAVEILIASFFITLLALAMPLYVIQILNRYISYGFHGTLITLTTGMLIAILMQLMFRILRTKMASAVN